MCLPQEAKAVSCRTAKDDTRNKLGQRLHHHAKRHCRGLELIERETHVVRARVSVILHEEARVGRRWHLPQVGARQPRPASVGLRVRAWNLRRIDPVIVAALRTRLRQARFCNGRWALRKPRVLPRRHGGRLLGCALVRRVNPSLYVCLGRIDLHPHKGHRLRHRLRRRGPAGHHRGTVRTPRQAHQWRPRRRRSAWRRVHWCAWLG
eukprot:scaffold120241_cov90-Phaeocystis_antarctica.AAC.5